MLTVADILRERDARITVRGRVDYWIVFSEETNLWTIISHKSHARNVVIEFDTEVEHQAVEKFLALTAQNDE